MSDYSMTTTKYGGGDKRWKRSFHDQVTLDGTLDGSLFTAGEEVLSGRVLGRVTATGRLGPYDNAAVDGRQTSAGHLDPDVKIKDATSRPHIAVFVGGTVNVTALPAGNGLDAAARADLPRITYYDGPVS